MSGDSANDDIEGLGLIWILSAVMLGADLARSQDLLDLAKAPHGL